MKENNIKEKLLAYLKNQYGTEPDFPWTKYPSYAVMRNMSGKWYAVIMTVPKSKLKIDGDGDIDIVNVKCGDIMSGSLLHEKGFKPAWHMNKLNWVSILLDGTLNFDEIIPYVKLSYELVLKN